MNKKIGFLVFLFFLASCDRANDPDSTPLDLEGKKALLDKKKDELDALEKEISRITDEIALLDPSLKEKAVLVNSTILTAQTFTRYVDIQGTVASDDVVNVVSEVPGRIIQLTVKEGDPVRRGQLVAKIDLESITKQIDEVEISLELARDVFERQTRLWNQQIGSEIQFLQTKNNKERLEISLETLNFQLSKASIYSPISGVVDREFSQLGELASPGSPIVQILNTSKVKVVADLPERYLRIVKKGQKVAIVFPSIDLEMKGKIKMLGRTIDPANRTLQIEIQLQGDTRILKPNLLAEVRLTELVIKEAIVIPVEYLHHEVDGKEFVYVVKTQDGQQRGQKLYVFSGEAESGLMVISDGLNQGMELVTKGTHNISDGELIQTVNLESGIIK